MTDAKIFMRKFVENKEAAKKDISSEEISKYKDFGSLMTNYQSTINEVHKKPLYKSKKGFLIILLIVLTVILIVQSQSEKKNEESVPTKELPVNNLD